MNTDPMPYIIFAALVSGAIGFFGCALMTSGAIRRAERRAYWDGFAACNREHAKLDDQPVQIHPDGSATYTPPRLRQA